MCLSECLAKKGHEFMKEDLFHKLDEEELYDLAELFKVFGDSTRIRILFYLFETESVNVGELAEALHMTVSAISHQLKILKQWRLVRSRRSGKQIYYSLADEHVHLIIETALEHIEE